MLLNLLKKFNYLLFLNPIHFTTANKISIFSQADNYLQNHFFTNNHFDQFYQTQLENLIANENDENTISDTDLLNTISEKQRRINQIKTDIKIFQKFYNLEETGYPDDDFFEITQKTKYCSNPDFLRLQNKFTQNQIIPNKFNTSNYITWTLSDAYFTHYLKYINPRNGLNIYQEVVNDINSIISKFGKITNLKFKFQEYNSTQNNKDITFRFAGASHGDFIVMDDSGKSVGHAFPGASESELSGKIHLDSKEGWRWRFKASSRRSKNFNPGPQYRNPPNLKAVILHMMGHVLGLQHSNDKDSMMNAMNNQNFGFSEDEESELIIPKIDVRNLRKIYLRKTLNGDMDYIDEKNSEILQSDEIITDIFHPTIIPTQEPTTMASFDYFFENLTEFFILHRTTFTILTFIFCFLFMASVFYCVYKYYQKNKPHKSQKKTVSMTRSLSHSYGRKYSRSRTDTNGDDDAFL